MRLHETVVKLPFLKWLSCLVFWFSSQAFAADPVDLLLAEQAFQITAKVKNADKVELHWDIADGYYLYRNKFKLVSLTPGINLGEQTFPTGLTKHDNLFGDVEIFRNHLDVEIAVQRNNTKQDKLILAVTFQGCADAGVCFMPIHKTIPFDLPAKHFDAWDIDSLYNNFSLLMSEQDNIAASLSNRPLWLITLSFLGFGLLLAFTPCVLPMIPIISVIIVGQSNRLTTRRAFMLSLSYVFASSVTYTIFGVMAGMFGSNLQALFQEPWVIMVFSGIFVLLACSMFGFFNLQMPAFIQNRIVVISARQQGGNLLGTAVMGMLSSLAVGPCITAPLTGVLIYIGQTGDALLGGLALFSLGLGMGIPLLIIGSSAGKLLPKAGAWMNATKAVFGMGLLAVAIWLLGRVMPPIVIQLLWQALLIIPLFYLGWKRLWKGAALIILTYALFLLIGVATHQQPGRMELLCTAAACEAPSSLPFQKVKSIDELQQTQAKAHTQGRWLMLDFYADWCVSCKEMALDTFSDPKVREALSSVVLVQVDVTQNSQTDQALLKKFNLIGPPAILFFSPDQQELNAYRVIGYMKAENFLAQLAQVFQLRKS